MAVIRSEPPPMQSLLGLIPDTAAQDSSMFGGFGDLEVAKSKFFLRSLPDPVLGSQQSHQGNTLD